MQVDPAGSEQHLPIGGRRRLIGHGSGSPSAKASTASSSRRQDHGGGHGDEDDGGAQQRLNLPLLAAMSAATVESPRGGDDVLKGARDTEKPAQTPKPQPAQPAQHQPQLSASLTSACELVQSILNQMSLKDAPPTNDHHYSTVSGTAAGAPAHNSSNLRASVSSPKASSVVHHHHHHGSNGNSNSNNNHNNNPSLLQESSLNSPLAARTTTTTTLSSTGGGGGGAPTVGTDDGPAGCASNTLRTLSFETADSSWGGASGTATAPHVNGGSSSNNSNNNKGGGGGDAGSSVSLSSSSNPQLSLFPEGHPVPLYQQLYHQYNEQHHGSNNKLGHKALATLCHWTLQMLYGNSTTSTTTTGIPRQIEMGKKDVSSTTAGTPTTTTIQSHAATTTVLRTSSGIGNNTPTTTTNKSGGGGSVVRTPWRKKKTPLLPPTHQSPHHRTSRSTSAAAAAAASQQQRTVRLQMFGSEYARHLSTSALAPPTSSAANNNNSNTHCSSPTHGGATTAATGVDASRRGGSGSGSPHHHATTPSTTNTRKSRRSTYKKHSSSSSSQQQKAKAQQAHHRLPPFARPLNVEEATPAVQTGAILDIIVTTDSQPPPTGYYRIGTTVSGRPFSFKGKGSNKSSSSSSSVPTLSSSSSSRSSQNNVTMYLNVKKETSWDKAAQRPCITALTVIFPDRQEFVPPGFCIVRNGKSRHHHHHHHGDGGGRDGGTSSGKNGNNSATATAASLDKNAGQPADIGGSSERVYLCFRRSREGNPITSIVPLSPWDQEDVPEGFTVVERTPRNFCANLNPAPGDKALFLAYRQRLANLETLRPLPLILSVPATSAVQQQQQQQHSNNTDENVGSSTQPAAASSTTTPTWLQAYYATGGTVVPAQVGRFHIMDRSTHSLLSPSSVANRLALIEKSRQQAGKKGLPTSSIRGDDLSAISAPRSRAESFESEDNVTAAGDGASTNSISEQATSTTRPNTASMTTSLAGEETSLGGDEFGSLSAIFRIKTGGITPPGSTGNGAVHGHSLFCVDEAEAQRYIQAMSFIPIVESAVRPDPTIALRLQARTTLITPILTACYNRHGGSALVAVEGLFTLLKAGFFQDDVDLSDDANVNSEGDGGSENNSCLSAGSDESSTRLTLLDLAIQVVCDVATTGAQETTFGACVEFVEQAVRFSQAQLNTRTIGYVVRFYLFVFYFGASVPTASQQWPNPAWGFAASNQTAPATSISSMSSITHSDGGEHGGGMGGGGGGGPMLLPTETFENSILFDPRSIQPSSTKTAAASSTYLPGGAPQTAALSFKELISLSIVRLGKISVNDILITCAASSSHLKGSLSDGGGGIGLCATSESLAHLLENLLSDVVDDAVDHVERANYTQLALHQIHRSGGSELFWHDMINACGAGLFGKDPRLTDAGRAIYIMIFAVMANLVKVSSGKIRGNCTAELMPRDVASKLLALELLLHFLEYWSDEQEAVSGMELMASEQTARVVSVDTLAFTIRRMAVPCLLSNTKSGLENPEVFKRVIKIVTELWRSPIYRSHCKAELGILMDHFALRLLEMGPQLIASSKIDLWSDQAHVSFRSQQMDLLKELKNMFLGDPKDAIEFYLNYDTDLTSQMTGPTQLIPGSQWKLFRRLCAGLCGIAEHCGELIGRQIAEHRAKINSRPQEEFHTFSSDDGTNSTPTDKAAVRESARLLRTSSLEAISQIVRAIAISVGATKGPKFTSLFLSWAPVGSPIAYETLLSSSRQEQSQSQSTEDDDDFDEVVRESEKKPDLYKSGVENHALDVAAELAKQKNLKKAVEYLIACNALTPAPRDIATYLRMHKTRFDPAALGQYLGECGVGGAETEYWNSIRLSYVRAISFLGMNVDEALRHFLTNSGFRLPGEAQKIDRIINTFAQCFFEDNAGDAQLCPFKNEDTVYLLCFAVIMLNTDLHRASLGSRRQRKKMTKQDFINNLRGVEQGEDIPRDYLCGIYDSIEASPMVMDDDLSRTTTPSSEDQHKNLQDMLNNTRSAESLLRGLAVHDFRFATIEDLAENLQVTPKDALSKLTRSLVSETWHQWHSVISTCLETAHLDLQGMEPCVDILLYALSITVCLDMKTERSAFLGQLGRLKSFEELRQGRWVHAPDYESFRGEAWYLELEEACCGSDDRRIWALRNIREWMESVQEALLDDVRNKAELTKACAQLDNGDTLLQDPARSFVRAGKLTKKSGRTGRSTEYHFVLFSDLLLYAKGDASGKYKIHEELPLHLTKVVDWFPSSQKNKQQNVFEIHHPRKSFQVVCRSLEERKSWVKDIREAILLEVERKMMLEAARLAVHSKA